MAPSGKYTSESVEFQAAGNRISGKLLLPCVEGPYPCAVVVHGSGSSSWDGTNGGLIPVLEAFALAGIAVLSWNKPGVGESSGDWRAQTFDDRASEVNDAIDYLRNRQEIDRNKIGMWGISQAGWIMPKVSARRTDVAFVVAVSCPVGTVVEQDLFRLSATMQADGFDEDQTSRAVEVMKLIRQKLSERAPFEEFEHLYAEYKDEPWVSLVHGEPSREMVEFGYHLATIDVAPDVAAFDCPVLAVFGEKDMIVDIEESSAHYSHVLAEAGNSDVEIRVFANANHGISVAETGGQIEATRMAELGVAKYAPGYLEFISHWVVKRTKS